MPPTLNLQCLSFEISGYEYHNRPIVQIKEAALPLSYLYLNQMCCLNPSAWINPHRRDVKPQTFPESGGFYDLNQFPAWQSFIHKKNSKQR
jgi:hypothetical protein